jgi:TonB family protein
VKTVVNPKEDLLLKKKKKDKVPVKEVVSEAAPVPSAPVPKPLNVPSAKDSGDSSVIPRAPAGSGVGIGIGGGGSGSPGNFPYTWYVHAVRQKIDANWTVSSGFDQRIFTQVAFTINKDGSIVRTEIEQGSGNEVFDRAAVRAVEYCNPLPPLPQGYAESDLRVHVRFTVKR